MRCASETPFFSFGAAAGTYHSGVYCCIQIKGPIASPCLRDGSFALRRPSVPSIYPRCSPTMTAVASFNLIGLGVSDAYDAARV
jgi:hypothetical protein